MKKYLCLIFLLVMPVLLSSCKPKAIKSNEQIPIQKETEHFIIKYSEVDENVIGDIIDKLETNYSKLTSDFHFAPQNKCTVNLYPTNSALQESLGAMYQNPLEAVGFTISSKEFSITSPNDTSHTRETYDEMLKDAVHEFTHTFLLNLSNELPLYLNEGIAAYEAEQSDTVWLTIKYAMIQKNGFALPSSMQELIDMTYQHQYGAVYDYGYTVVEYIVKEYGYNALVKLIKSNGDVATSIEIDEDSFYNGWIEYLKEFYA